MRATPTSPSPKKSSKNNQLYFTQSVRSRLEKCSSCGSLPCVSTHLLHALAKSFFFLTTPAYSPAIPARLCALIRDMNLCSPAFPLNVSCLVFSVFSAFPHFLFRTPRSENPTKPNTPFDKSPQNRTQSKNRLVRKYQT